MHSSRCIPWGSQVPTILLPRWGSQIVVVSGAGAAVLSGLSGHRNFAVWVMLDSIDTNQAAGKENIILCSCAFVHPGKADIIANLALGSPPYGRIVPSDDWSDISITASVNVRVWLEDLSTQKTSDP